MKQCFGCNMRVEDSTNFCPNCGGTQFFVPMSKQQSTPQLYYSMPTPAQTPKTKTGAKASFVLSIIAVCIFWIPVVGPIFALLSLILAIIDKLKTSEFAKTDKAIASIIMSAIALLLGIIISYAILHDSETSSSESEPSVESAEEVAAKPSEEEIKEEYITKCKNLEYKDVARNPDDFKGEFTHIRGEVVQVMENNFLGERTADFWIMEDGDFEKVWYISYTFKIEEGRILEHDIVDVYGKCSGVHSYTTVMLSQLTIPSIRAEYIELATFSSSRTNDETGEIEEIEVNGTEGEVNAYKSALHYLNLSAMSCEGLKRQLSFEQYSDDEIQFALDNIEVDWDAQALKSAKNYLSFTAMSYTGLIKQLQFEGFTDEQAKYAADNCEADWKEQAVKSAKNYMIIMTFSKAELKQQLEFEGYTSEEAQYAVDEVYE